MACLPRMFGPCRCLDSAGAANVAIHLHLAVGEGTLVALGAEDIVGHPMDSILQKHDKKWQKSREKLMWVMWYNMRCIPRPWGCAPMPWGNNLPCVGLVLEPSLVIWKAHPSPVGGCTWSWFIPIKSHDLHDFIGIPIVTRSVSLLGVEFCNHNIHNIDHRGHWFPLISPCQNRVVGWSRPTMILGNTKWFFQDMISCDGWFMLII